MAKAAADSLQTAGVGDIRAQGKAIPISAQKVRLLVNLVRGKNVVEALNILKFMPNGAAHPVSKVIASAMANAEENFGVSRDDLYVHYIVADEAPTRKWRRFGARGRFKPWLRRASHVTVVLREKS
jgi:large subunit ribosomal protein L22